MPIIKWNAPMAYWAYSDEKAFFTWLESISGVVSVKGIGRELFIHLRSRRMSRTALMDLIAIYKRYGGDLSQLAQLLTPENEHWFKDPIMYWHKDMFPKGNSSKVRKQRNV